MSTPATYQFIGQHPAPAATTLYLHLDGYEQGAANYFRAMLAQEEGPRVEAFMRANTQFKPAGDRSKAIKHVVNQDTPEKIFAAAT